MRRQTVKVEIDIFEETNSWWFSRRQVPLTYSWNFLVFEGRRISRKDFWDFVLEEKFIRAMPKRSLFDTLLFTGGR